MKIVQINTVSGVGSVGRICVDLYDTLQKMGHEPYIAIGRGTLDKRLKGYKIGNVWDFGCHVMKNFFQPFFQKPLIGVLLNFNQVRHLKNFFLTGITHSYTAANFKWTNSVFFH